MDAKKIVGDNIRGYRKISGWTQIQLAERAGVNSEHLSRLESGLENVTLETLEKIASKLKVDLAKLFIKESYKEK